MHGQEIFQVFTDLNHSDLGLCTGYIDARVVAYCVRYGCIAQRQLKTLVLFFRLSPEASHSERSQGMKEYANIFMELGTIFIHTHSK